jgi:hypothetical protein
MYCAFLDRKDIKSLIALVFFSLHTSAEKYRAASEAAIFDTDFADHFNNKFYKHKESPPWHNEVDDEFVREGSYPTDSIFQSDNPTTFDDFIYRDKPSFYKRVSGRFYQAMQRKLQRMKALL